MAAIPTLSDGPSWGQCAPYGGAGWVELPDGEILIFGQHGAFPALPEAACEILDGMTLRRLLKAGADRPWEAEQVRRIWARMNPSIQQSRMLDAMIDDLTGWQMVARGVGRIRAYKFRPMSFGAATRLGTNGKATLAEEFGTAPPDAGGGDIAEMSYGQRVVASMPHAVDAVIPELKKELSKLLKPEALAVMVAAIALLVGVAMTGIGVAALVVVGWALVGWVVFELVELLMRFLKAIGEAEDEADLKEAGRLFAEFMVRLGIEGGTTLLFGFAAVKVAGKAGGAAQSRRAAQADEASGRGRAEPGREQAQAAEEKPAALADDVAAARRAAGSVPKQVVDDIAAFLNKSPKEVEKLYEQAHLDGIHFDRLIADYVKKNPGVSPEEAHYIFGYTTNFFYKPLNGMLRGDPAAVTPAAANLRDKLNAALMQLPPQKMTVYRGLGDMPENALKAFDAKYATGQVIEDGSFISASPKSGDAYGGTRNMVIETISARDISPLAMDVQFPAEIGKVGTASEIIIPAGSEMIVRDAVDGVVRLMEVP